MNDKTEFNIIVDGEEKVAELVTKLYVDELGLQYIYYYIKEENDNDDTEKLLLASRVETDENGVDEIIEIKSEEERKIAFKVFQDTYENIGNNVD